MLSNMAVLRAIAIVPAILLVVTLIVGCVIFHRKATKNKSDLARLKYQIDEQKRRIDDLSEQEHKIAKIRHDYKNHISVGLSLLKSGETVEAQQYLSKYSNQELSKIYVYVDTSNDFINAVINDKFRLCAEKGITPEAEISFVEQKVDDIDLCSVLFNLLDNAIEACEKLDKERRIKLVMFQHKAYLVVRVINTADDSMIEKNTELITTKTDKKNHGMGTKIVSEIARKYNGFFNTEQKCGSFCAEIWLKNV